MTNNLLDLSEFDTLSNNSSGYNTGPILELTPNLANEDTLNSNLNPAAMPFTPMGNTFVPAAANANVNPFQDNFINNKPQDNNQVPGMCAGSVTLDTHPPSFVDEYHSVDTLK